MGTMTIVRDVMSGQIVAVRRGATFKEMAATLREYRISGFPVISDDGKVIGVVSEADLLLGVKFGRHLWPWGVQWTQGAGGTMDDLLERYEAYGDESVYVEARRQYEQALEAGRDDARILTNFGYLQECHGRLSIQAAVECYERAIEADPQYDKPHWQLIAALSELGRADQAVTRYRRRVAEAPR